MDKNKPCVKCGSTDRYERNLKCKRCSVRISKEYQMRNLEYTRISALERYYQAREKKAAQSSKGTPDE